VLRVAHQRLLAVVDLRRLRARTKKNPQYHINAREATSQTTV
jgi:hypothetical protein